MMKSLCTTLSLCLLLFFLPKISAQTTLGPGDIAFTGYNSDDPDEFSIVLLKDVVSGTTITFTDNEYKNGVLTTGEGRLTLTFQSNFSCGDEFYFLSSNQTSNPAPWSVTDGSGSNSNLSLVNSVSASVRFSGSGDTFLAFQDNNPGTTTNPARWLAGINMAGSAWQNLQSNDSDLPPTLTNGQTAIAITPEVQNAKYDCSTTSGGAAVLATAINTQGNWNRSASSITLNGAGFCGFSCAAACTNPVLNSISASPNPVCPGNSTTITINGSLNDGGVWSLREGSCNATATQTTTGSTFPVSPSANTTYFVTAPNCDGSTQVCESVAVTVSGIAANAGPDQLTPGTITTLAGNSPGAATGSWSIISGIGGNIATPSSPTSSFSGIAGQAYVLRWTINNGVCGNNSDDVKIAFSSPTALTIGDMAFIEYVSDNPDFFSVVFLTDILAGTEVHFTERGWLSTGGFRAGESTLTVTWCAPASCGEVFQIVDNSVNGSSWLLRDASGEEVGTAIVTGTGNFQLATSGDQIFAYQGSEPTAGNEGNFRAAIHMNGDWDTAPIDATAKSAQPQIFINNPNTSVAPNTGATERDNTVYNCSVTVGSKTTLLAAINDHTNWDDASSNDSRPLNPTFCGFSCCPAPSYTSVNASSSEFCPGDMVTLTVVGDQGGGTSWVWYEGSCGTGTQVGTGAVITVSPTATTTYYVRAEGGCLTSAESCQSVVVSLENTPPTITCPADITVSNDASACTAVVSYSAPTGTDNCPGATTLQTAGLGSGAAFPVGVTTETYEVTASNGQTASCSFTVTVNDTEDPVITCVATPANRNNDPGQCNYTAQGTEFDATATDNCPGVTVTNDFNNSSSLTGEDFPVGTTTVVWTATDAAGNQAGCAIDIVVKDNEDPVIVCQDLSLELGMDGTVGFGVNIIAQSDNCGLQGGAFRTGPTTFTCAELGDNPITIFKNDINGNNTTCNIILTILDNNFPCNEPPVANCKDVTVDADGNCQGTAAAADFNDGSSDPDGDALSFSVAPVGPYPIGVTNVVLTVSDGQETDQCNAMITVVDNSAPVTDCSAINPDRNNDPGQCSYTTQGTEFDATATDNCGVASLTNDYNNSNSLAGAIFPVGINQVVWTATDAAGNINSCTILVDIADNEDPVADCSAINPNRNNDPGQCSYTAQGTEFDATATDNCAVTSLTNNINGGNSLAGQVFPVGTTNVIWTAMDAAGNAHSCSVTINITDNEAPTLQCQDLVRHLGPGGNIMVFANEYVVSSDDNCEVNLATLDVVPNNFSAALTFNVTVTVQDIYGNVGNCTPQVTILKRPTTLVNNGVFSGQYNETVTLTATLTDDLAGGTGRAFKTVFFSLGSFNGSAVTDANGVASINVTLNQPPGNYTLTTSFAGDGTFVGSTDSDAFVIEQGPTTITNLGVFSGQYSDQATVQALLIDQITGNPLPDRTVTFNLTGLPPLSATTNASGIATVSFLLDLAPTVLGSTYTISASFAGDSFYLSSSDIDPFTVLQEDAIVTYTGAYLVSTAGANSSTATVTLAATIQDAPDGFPGDIRNARVTFVDRESSDIIAADLPVVLIDPTDLSTGSVVYNWTNVDIGNQDFDEFEIGIIVTHYYTRNSSDDNVMITVSKPLDNFITGGGYLILENSAGSLAGDTDSKLNFSLNVKFNPSGNNVKGRVQFLVRRLESDGIVHTYRFKSNKISSMAIDPTTGIATINGKMNIQDITDPNNSISLGGNRIFQLTLQDNGNPGTNDLLGITVYGNGGGLIFSSNWTGTITAEQHLAGGNIKVHTSGKGNLATTIKDPASATFPEAQPNEPSVHPLEVQLFPNPAIDQIHFAFAAQQDGQWNIDLLDASGALVRQERYLATEGSNQHELDISSLSPGIYWFRLSSKEQVLLARFIRVKK